ncbi:vesicle-associated protein 3-1-like isoform X2 [Oryza brachyantha]|uniref:vesicle-associated protein 3-1-like isoform X2 n=1 Tax=Oryza brachyantha TaxID=4533 RepID=UPI00077663EE|nr:vesicle-associated protein 3-1-like isoform X2 [Oryza brachyantha]
MSNRLLRVHPSELKIPYEVKRKRSCCMQLTNRTDQCVAFKVKTTNPRKYSVRHACGILLPRSSCDITVTMQAPHEVLSDYHCRDKFLVQSVVVGHRATMRDFAPELFAKVPGRVIEEFKLRVVYVAANPPSPVPEEEEEEEEEEDASPRSEVTSYEVKISPAFDAVSTRTYTSEAKVSSAENETLDVTIKSSVVNFFLLQFVLSGQISGTLFGTVPLSVQPYGT